MFCGVLMVRPLTIVIHEFVDHRRPTSEKSSFVHTPIWRSPSFIRTTTSAAPAASVSTSTVFAEPEQSAPLARASSQNSDVGFSVVDEEVRREEEEDLGAGGHEGNGLWHLGSDDYVSDLLFYSRNYFV